MALELKLFKKCLKINIVTEYILMYFIYKSN